ncbi:SRPBCC domain-containing protein [Pleurocapsales cyanobacterium LEGE 06147]|nr:SRPBCC domain-containing protein [Pleurocapsales cyanobacterium LEGE 06147]
MTQTVKIDVFYPHPPEKVWRALTNSRALAAWLMNNNFEPRIGHKFQFYDDSLPGLKMTIQCEIIELDEPNRLVYTWQDCLTAESSLAIWTLTKREEGTQLQLRHLETSVAIASGVAQGAIATPSMTPMTIPHQYIEKRNITTSGLFLSEMGSDSYNTPTSGFAASASSPRFFEWDYYLKQRLLDWLQQEY